MSLTIPGFPSHAPVAFTHDGARLVAGNDHGVAVFDVGRERKLRTFGGSHHGHGARALIVDGDLVYALPGSHWGLAAWDLTTGRYRGKIVGEAPAGGFALDAPNGVLWVARGRRVEGFDTKTGAALFDPKRRKPIASFVAAKSGELLGVAVAEGGPLLFWGDRSWGISRDRKTVATTKGEPATSGGFVGAHAYVVFEHRVAVVDPLTAKVLAEAKLRSSAWLSCASSTRIFVTTDAALAVLSWNGRKLELEREIACANIHGVGCTADGARAAIAIAEETRTVIRLVALGRGDAVLSNAPAPETKRAPRKRKLSKNDPLWGVPEEKWAPKNHVDFREYVANEHLVDGMPIVELHRNHGVPLSRVRRWIDLYRDGGRAALDASLDGALARPRGSRTTGVTSRRRPRAPAQRGPRS